MHSFDQIKGHTFDHCQMYRLAVLQLGEKNSPSLRVFLTENEFMPTLITFESMVRFCSNLYQNL